MTRHLKKWRHSQFDVIDKLIKEYKVIGIGSVSSYPAALLHKLKKNLTDVTLKVTNKNVLKKVLEAQKQTDLIKELPAQPILILSNKNAFEIYSSIKKNKSKSKAKVGMISPIDIIIQECDTGLPPGPALSDLKKVGLKAQVKGPTIHIVEDAVVTKKGAIVTSDVVSTLSKLGIKPIELMLDVVCIKEAGLIYKKDVLSVDLDEINSQIMIGIRSAIAIGVEMGYATSLTIEPMIMMAELKAKALESAIASKNPTEGQ
ncbi:MAG: 50S ribosomal protein L10 [archaeon]